MTVQLEFSRIVDVSRLPPEGVTKLFEATETECAALASRFDVPQIRSLVVDVSVQPWKKNGCRVRGTAAAVMTRVCVVSLEEFDSTLKVKLDRLFTDSAVVRFEGREIEVSLEEDDMGEVVDGDVEVGEFAVQELLLELDPHPRKRGVEFAAAALDSGTAGGKDERENPFAVLKALKKGD